MRAAAAGKRNGAAAEAQRSLVQWRKNLSVAPGAPGASSDTDAGAAATDTHCCKSTSASAPARRVCSQPPRRGTGYGLGEPVPDQKAAADGQRGESAVARPEERKFLGFSISNDGSKRRIAPKALDKFKTRVWEMTRRTRGSACRS
jgi:hypothetical protein